MKPCKPEKHVVYLLKRKSDSKLYVGITILRRIKTRMADHRRSKRFYQDDFEVTILEESDDRNKIEQLEEYYIKKYDTHCTGLNCSPSGKGCGHNSPRFTTLGYIYSPQSRKKMSIKAKARAKRDHDKMSERSRQLWNDPEYRKRQEGKREGKRLRPPKLTDDQVKEIRKLFAEMKGQIENDIRPINETRIKMGYSPATPEREFAKRYCRQYAVSETLIRNIVTNKTRTECLPQIYRS